LDKKHPVFEAMLEKADGNAYLPLTCIKQCLAQSDALFVSPAFAGSVAAREMVGELLPYCMIGAPAEGQSAADFIKTAFKESIQWLQAQY
jgi:hypothetical protein